ncbi:MAG: hypothetical protein WA979_09505 [Pacificimonas sp.]
MKLTSACKTTCLVAALLTSGTANAVDVDLSGTVIDSCILTLSTEGVLTSGASGTTLSSSNALGAPAILGVVATGGLPSVDFSAPTLSAQPGGYSGTPTVSMAYTSLGGASQSETTGASSYTSALLLDAVTVQGTVTDSSGFVAGDYTVTSIATCSQ